MNNTISFKTCFRIMYLGEKKSWFTCLESTQALGLEVAFPERLGLFS